MTATNASIKTPRFDVQRLSIRIVVGRNIKLLVFRNDRSDLPRLTVSFNNPSKEIDLHLTSVNGALKSHESLARIPEKTIMEALAKMARELERLKPDIRRSVRTITVAQLARRGYSIAYITPEKEEEFIEALGPREKRKGVWRRVAARDPEAAVETIDLDDYLHKPSFLFSLTPPKTEGRIVFAFRRVRKDLEVIPLKLVNTVTGNQVWYRLDATIILFKNALDAYFENLFNEMLAPETAKKIASALQLDEL